MVWPLAYSCIGTNIQPVTEENECQCIVIILVVLHHRLARISEIMLELEVIFKRFGLPISYFEAEVKFYLFRDADTKQIQAVTDLGVLSLFL